MSRRVVITGLGPISGLGTGIEPTWERVIAGRSAVGPIQAFDSKAFDCQLAAEVEPFSVREYVPKSYRKAIKVMARDIELAVVAAALAARDADLTTRGTANGTEIPLSYESPRIGAHIGAGLIAAELDELTGALVEATDEQGRFMYEKWGQQGMQHLTPLWLLKYLPNMLACHVTIIHDAQGPSNTITCGEASAMLSVGESLRVIQRNAADLCFCGGAESKINPMTFLRQMMTSRVNTSDNENPAEAVRPFCQTAGGTIVGEGGGIVTLESLDTYRNRVSRDGASASHPPYAEVLGFGASQSVNIAARNLEPDPEGRGIALAIRLALRDAGMEPDQIDLIVPFGIAVPSYDRAEASALRSVFGERLADVPVVSIKSMAGNCGAGAGGLDVCVAAKALAQQTLPATINCKQPLSGLQAGTAPSRSASINYAVAYNYGLGGQNAALVLKRFEQ